MTITITDVQNRTGTTYSSSTDPTNTQVTNFITAATDIFTAHVGSAPSDDVDDEIMLQIVINLIRQYYWLGHDGATAMESVSFPTIELFPMELYNRLKPSFVYEGGSDCSWML